MDKFVKAPTELGDEERPVALRGEKISEKGLSDNLYNLFDKVPKSCDATLVHDEERPVAALKEEISEIRVGDNFYEFGDDTLVCDDK